MFDRIGVPFESRAFRRCLFVTLVAVPFVANFPGVLPLSHGQTAQQPSTKKPPAKTPKAPKPPPPAIQTFVPSRKLEPSPLTDYAAGPLPEFLRGAEVWLPANVVDQPLGYRDGRLDVRFNEPGVYLFAFSWANGDDLSGYWEKGNNDFRSFLKMGFDPLLTLDLNWPRGEQPTRYYVFSREMPARFQGTMGTRRSVPPVIIRLAADVPFPPREKFDPDYTWPENYYADAVAAKLLALLHQGNYVALDEWTGRLLQGGDHFPNGSSKLRVLTRRFDKAFFDWHSKEDMASYVERAEAWRAKSPNSPAAVVTAVRSLCARANHLEHGGWNEPQIVEESRRRALELTYDYQNAHPDSPLPRDLTLYQARSTDWSMELVNEFMDQLLDADIWAPEALIDSFSRVAQPTGFSQRTREQIGRDYDAYFAHLADRADPKDRDAYYAWIMGEAGWVRMHVEYGYGMDVPAAKRGFEELLRRYPQSRRLREQYCWVACLTGDRPLAARLFQELGPFAAAENKAFDSDGTVAAFRAWAAADCPTGEQKALFETTNVEPLIVRWRREGGELLVGDARGALWTFDASGRRELLDRTYSFFVTRSPAAAQLTPEAERFVTGGVSGIASIARAEDRDAPKRWQYGAYLPQNTAVALSDDRHWLASASTGPMFDVVTANTAWGARLKGLGKRGPGGDVSYLEFLAENNRFVTADWNGEVRLWRIVDGEKLDFEATDVRKAHNAPGYCSGALSPDKTQLATYGGDKALKIWRVDTGEMLNEFPDLPRPVFGLRFSPNGRFLAIGEGSGDHRPSNVVIYDLEAKRAVKTFVGHKASVSSLDFAPDGRTLATCGFDLTVRLWDLTSLWR